MSGPGAARRPRGVPATTGPRSRRTTTGAAEIEDRVAELEQRLMELEGRRPNMEHTRTWFRQLVPPEATGHFKTAGREQLLGLRALVDHWIGRLDPEMRTQPRETIPIE